VGVHPAYRAPASSADAALFPNGPAVVLDSSSQAHTGAGGKAILSYNRAVTSPSPPEAPMTSMPVCEFSSPRRVHPCGSRYLFLHTPRIRVTPSRFPRHEEFRVHQRSSPKRPSIPTKMHRYCDELASLATTSSPTHRLYLLTQTYLLYHLPYILG